MVSKYVPHIEEPKDESDRMCNCIHIYSTLAANKLEQMQQEIDRLKVFEEYVNNQKEVKYNG